MVRDPRPAATSEFARSLQGVSDSFNALHKRREAAEDDAFLDQFRMAYGVRAAQIEAQETNSDAVGRPDFVEHLDGLLADAQKEEMDRLVASGNYRLSDSGRQRADEVAHSLRLSSARSAVVSVNNERVSFLVDSAYNNVDQIARIAGGNGDIVGAMERVDETASRLDGVVAPSKVRDFRRRARDSVLTNTIEGHIARGEYGKAQAILDSQTGFASPGASPLQKDIVAAAKKEGVDPLLLLGIADAESNFDASARPTKDPESIPEGRLSPMTSEAVGVTSEGRTVYRNEDGSYSSERTVTVQDDRINGGKWTNIPTVYGGREVDQATAIQIIAGHEGTDPETGRKLEGYATEPEAVSAAKARSAGIETKLYASSATGPFQIIDETRAGLDRPTDVTPVSDAEKGARLTASNSNLLKKALGVPPTPAQIYLTHVLGYPSAVRVLNAAADTPLESILTEDAFKANPHLRGMTAAEALGWAKRKIEEHMKAVAPALDGREYRAAEGSIPVSQAATLSRRISDGKGTEAASIRGLIKDDIASIRSTGERIDIDEQRAAAILPPATYADWVQSRRDAEVYWEATKDMVSMREDAIQERVDLLMPAGGDEGFADQAALYDDVNAYAKKIVTMRAKDPAMSVASIPEVRAAAEALAENQTPEGWQKFFDARMAAQEQVGIPSGLQLPLTNDEARRWGAPLRNLPDQDWVSVFTQYANEIERQFGSYGDEVMAQVIDEYVKDRDQAKVAQRLIKNIMSGDQPITRSDAAAVDEAIETRRIRSAAEVFGAAERVAAMVRESRDRGVLGYAPSAAAIQRLRDDPSLLGAFVEAYGEDQVPADLKK